MPPQVTKTQPKESVTRPQQKPQPEQETSTSSKAHTPVLVTRPKSYVPVPKRQCQKARSKWEQDGRKCSNQGYCEKLLMYGGRPHVGVCVCQVHAAEQREERQKKTQAAKAKAVSAVVPRREQDTQPQKEKGLYKSMKSG